MPWSTYMMDRWWVNSQMPGPAAPKKQPSGDTNVKEPTDNVATAPTSDNTIPDVSLSANPIPDYRMPSTTEESTWDYWFPYTEPTPEAREQGWNPWQGTYAWQWDYNTDRSDPWQLAPGWAANPAPSDYSSYTENEGPWSSTYAPEFYAPGGQWFYENYDTVWDSATGRYRYQPRNQNTFMNPWKHSRRWQPRPAFGQNGEPIDGSQVGGVRVMGGKNSPAAQQWLRQTTPEQPEEPQLFKSSADWYGSIANFRI